MEILLVYGPIFIIFVLLRFVLIWLADLLLDCSRIWEYILSISLVVFSFVLSFFLCNKITLGNLIRIDKKSDLQHEKYFLANQYDLDAIEDDNVGPINYEYEMANIYDHFARGGWKFKPLFNDADLNYDEIIESTKEKYPNMNIQGLDIQYNKGKYKIKCEDDSISKKDVLDSLNVEQFDGSDKKFYNNYYYASLCNKDKLMMLPLTEEERVDLGYVYDQYLKGKNSFILMYEHDIDRFNVLLGEMNSMYPALSDNIHFTINNLPIIKPRLSLVRTYETKSFKEADMNASKLSQISKVFAKPAPSRSRERTLEAIEKAKEIVAMTDGMDDYEAEKFFVDYLANNTKYELNCDFNQDAYSALILNKSVCAGYAKAFNMLMDLKGIPCDLIIGMAKHNVKNVEDSDGRYGNHAWNLVKLDDQYLLTDPTWCDYEYTNEIHYQYFNMPLNVEYVTESHIPFKSKVEENDNTLTYYNSENILAIYGDEYEHLKSDSIEYTYFFKEDLIARNENELRQLLINDITNQRYNGAQYNMIWCIDDAANCLSKDYDQSSLYHYCMKYTGTYMKFQTLTGDWLYPFMGIDLRINN